LGHPYGWLPKASAVPLRVARETDITSGESMIQPVRMEEVEQLASFQGRRVAGLDPGHVNMPANDSGHVLTQAEGYDRFSLLQACQ
jgi:hypothetical protein